MAKLKTLTARRESIVSSVTRFKAFLENLGENFQIEEVIERLSKIEPLFEQFSEIQIEIAEVNANESTAEQTEEFENQYFSAISQAKRIINKKSQLPQNNASVNPSCDYKLPKLSVPQFSGAFNEWISFKSSFNSMIHNNAKLNNLQKYHYLLSALRGDAALTIQGMDLTDQNYSQAWQAILERYDMLRKNVYSHLDKLTETSPLTKESCVGLRKLIDDVSISIRALRSLNRSVDNWDDIIVYLTVKKLDSTTKKEWDRTLGKDDMPTFKQLIEFLNKKCVSLESSSSNVVVEKIKVNNHLISINKQCNLCKGDHKVANCDKFKALTVENRINKTRELGLCINCIKPANHTVNKCFARPCYICNKRHNTLLHLNKQPIANQIAESNNNPQSSSSNFAGHSISTVEVLLSTVVLKIFDKNNKTSDCRALLDCGSQSNFITHDLVNKLDLEVTDAVINISGINNAASQANKLTTVKIKSNYDKFTTTLNCIVVPSISNNLPSSTFSRNSFKYPHNIKLADPKFNMSRPVNLLIGAELFWQLMCVGQIINNKGGPVLQKTQLGWIVGGGMSHNNNKIMCNHSTNQINFDLRQFWEIENLSTQQTLTPEEGRCLTIFEKTYERDDFGRFIVKLPFKCEAVELGNSRALALKRFFSIENKLNKNPQLKTDYVAFMREYRELGHMKVLESPDDNIAHYYIPHHAVIKDSSVTTKLRVVFDASAKTTNQNSLNDVLLKGPVIQDDLFSILIRFRLHKYVLSADIIKMYRQILVGDSDTEFQRIFWRENSNEPLQVYALQTVTYGTTPASFLATKCLQQLALDNYSQYPLACEAIIKDCYVDDILTGSHEKEGLINLRNQLIEVLRLGCFELNKWNSNDSEILDGIDNNEFQPIICLDKNDINKVLGLQWDSRNDLLKYSVAENSINRATKRTILSDIAKLYDPLGLLNPLIVTAKLIIQDLWRLNINWDESIPMHLHSQWTQFRRQLSAINEIKINRFIGSFCDAYQVQLHGFSDASEKAYGACIYLRYFEQTGQWRTNLICAKSRVAPLKKQSLPRLELCGALLLANLMKQTTSSINDKLKIKKLFYWSDSTIVISWIKSESAQLKTFVANRTAEIQELTNPNDWYHVSSTCNPADILSRGLMPQEIINLNNWWHGPDWLSQEEAEWPVKHNNLILNHEAIPEIRKTITCHTIVEPFHIFSRISKFTRLIRATAYCLRFRQNCKLNNNDKLVENLSAEEIKNASIVLIKNLQNQCFNKEIQDLKSTGVVSPKSALLCLSPFLDDEGVIRVGGRLRKSSLCFNQKHQILLPKSHKFTELLIRHEHEKNQHSGIQTTLAAVRLNYWPLGAKNAIKKIIHKCVTCFKVNPPFENMLMGDLPKARLEIKPVFYNCGVDYCGPFLIKEGVRKIKTLKAYAAIFVCFATRAVHVELVSNLTTEAFIACLRRFVARRGKVAHMYSDNGTNFVGASRELNELHKLITSADHKSRVDNILSQDGITWHFIPPRSPHFNGLAEAGVKSLKHHLKRVMGDTKLTFEELNTLLVQIEAILNSRPLTPMSNDPNDPQYITPSHFITGDSLLSIADPNLMEIKTNKLSRWQHIQQLKQHFWRRWATEYVQNLQTKGKWKTASSKHPEVGQLAVVKEDNLPPLRWIVGRITEVHPGSDGIPRVVTLRTSSGTIKRATARIAVLPVEN